LKVSKYGAPRYRSFPLVCLVPLSPPLENLFFTSFVLSYLSIYLLNETQLRFYSVVGLLLAFPSISIAISLQLIVGRGISLLAYYQNPRGWEFSSQYLDTKGLPLPNYVYSLRIDIQADWIIGS
jgi:hypothetical protein